MRGANAGVLVDELTWEMDDTEGKRTRTREIRVKEVRSFYDGKPTLRIPRVDARLIAMSKEASVDRSEAITAAPPPPSAPRPPLSLVKSRAILILDLADSEPECAEADPFGGLILVEDEAPELEEGWLDDEDGNRPTLVLSSRKPPPLHIASQPPKGATRL